MLVNRRLFYGYRTISISDIELARNVLASAALREQCTHLLFIDADMGFRSQLIAKMLQSDEEFVGAICPKRTMDLEALIAQLADKGGDGTGSAKLQASQALDYVGNLRSDTSCDLEMRGGFISVDGIGMALCLLRRSVLERMVDNRSAQQLILREGDRGLAEFPVYGFFDKVHDASGARLSEDYSFCYRWTTGCAGKIWACVDEPITHVGSVEFTGTFLDKMIYLADRS